MAVPSGKTSVEVRMQASLPSAVAHNVTREYPLGHHHRSLRFREWWVVAGQTINSVTPATNYMVAQLWNYSDSTKIAQGTIVGVGATVLGRMTKKSLGTTAQFTTSEASANKMYTVKIVGTSTLPNNLRRPQIEAVADAID